MPDAPRFAWLWWWRPPFIYRTVIVNLRSEETALRGVIWRTRGRWLTMRGASLMKAGDPPRSLVGELVVDRNNVSFIQMVD